MSDEPSYVPGRLADLRKDVSRSGRPGADFVFEVVDRLATHPDMATIWKALGKLPDSQERESKLVDRACIAYGVTFSLFPKRSEVDGKNSLSSIDNTPAFIFNELARAATDAARMMKGLSDYFAAEIVGYDKAIAVLDKVTFAAKQKAAGDPFAQWWQENAQHFPQPPRSRSKKGRRAYFSEIMAEEVRQCFGKDRHDLVTIIEDVVFDLRGSLDVETVRKRRQRRDSSRQPS